MLLSLVLGQPLHLFSPSFNNELSFGGKLEMRCALLKLKTLTGLKLNKSPVLGFFSLLQVLLPFLFHVSVTFLLGRALSFAKAGFELFARKGEG